MTEKTRKYAIVEIVVSLFVIAVTLITYIFYPNIDVKTEAIVIIIAFISGCICSVIYGLAPTNTKRDVTVNKI